MAGSSIVERLSGIANIIFHQGVAVLTVFVITVMFQHLPNDDYTAWHATLVTTGFIFLVLESLIQYTGSNLYTKEIDRVTKAKIHGILAGVGAILIITGITLKIVDKTSNHFESNHAIIGLITLILVVISVIFGPLTAYGTAAIKCLIRPVWMKIIHISLGIVTLGFGLTAFGLGISKDFFKLLWTTENTVTAALVGMAIFALWACLDPFRTLYNNFKTAIGK